jgi:hypothetical protein
VATDLSFWQGPPLSAEDFALVEAYRTVGVPLDELPYTEDFERLMKLLQRPRTKDQMRYVWLRLISLRKRYYLPHLK